MFLSLLFSFLLVHATAFAAQLQVDRPLQSQRPRLARFGSSYSWEISPFTFGYDDGGGAISNVTYSATGLPSWLAFNPNNASFTGQVPSIVNGGSFTITLTATDGSSRASDSFNFLISDNPEPQLAIPLAQQITPYNSALSPAFPVNPSSALPPYSSNTTALNGKAGLRIPPTWTFSFGFLGSTFSPWPLVYSAMLANGDPLPDWIRYDAGSFTFDGTAPDVNSLEMEIVFMASDEAGYSTTAADSFWVIVAAHELKLKDAAKGIVRNVTVGSDFEVRLMDGGDDDPLVGEALWDAGPLPRWGVRNITLSTSGVQYGFNDSAYILTGSLSANQSSQALPIISMQITDTQNLTLFTHLALHPVSAFFQLPANATLDNSGAMVIPGNRGLLSSFTLKDFITTEGQALVHNRGVNITMDVIPETARSWFSLDQAGFVTAANTPSDLDSPLSRASTSSSSTLTSNASQSVSHERRKHHRYSRLEEVFDLASFTSPPSLSHSTSTLSPSPTTIPTSLLTHSSPPTVVNVTFIAHSYGSRTISKLRTSFHLTANATCPSSSNSCTTTNGTQNPTRQHVVHLASILLITFTLILVCVLIVVLFWMYRKGALCIPRISRKQTKTTDEKVEPYVLKQDKRAGGELGADELERGVGGRIASMAETRSIATSETRGGSPNGSRGPSPTNIGHEGAARVKDADVNGNGNGSNTESSGSRYEDGSSLGTRARNGGGGGVRGGGMNSDQGESSAESEVGGNHLAPPMNAYNHSLPASVRSVSPTPSSATAASARSGATIPKQTFFAKLKNLGPPRPHDPSSSSSDDEARPSKQSQKPSFFANVVPTIKESSLGSLLGLTGEESVKKATIGKPRPFMPSLGAYLARDHADQVARAAASKDIVSREASDGGASFTGGTAIIYSMRNSPLPTNASPLSNLAIEKVSPAPNGAASSSHTDVARLLRQRSTRSAIPAAPSGGDSFSSTSESTVTSGINRDSRALDGLPSSLETSDIMPKEEPRRRVDFIRPGAGIINQGGTEVLDTVPPNLASPLHHSRLRSQDSVDSVAVVATAALAIRSPLAGARLVPSPKPYLPDIHPATYVAPPAPPSHQTEGSAPGPKARLVQFVHERQYDSSSSDTGDDRVPGAYSAYQGKREISQKAMVGGSSGTPPEHWEEISNVNSNPALGGTIGGSGSGLAEKVKMLREQSRILHEQRVVDATAESRRQARSPAEANFFDDPTLAAGIHYIQSLPSNDRVTTDQDALSGREMGVALGGDTDENASTRSVAGRAKIVASGSRTRPRISQTQPSFIAYDPHPQSSDSEKRTPPRIPLPAPPATQYFDLSESSSGSSSSSRGSGVIRHRAGQERILVGVNEPFNFPAPLHLPGSSPGQSSRVRILNELKSSQTESNALTVRLWAEMDDGSPLPEWLGFDNQEAEFWGVPERGNQGGSLRIKVYLREAEEVKEVGRFIIEIVGR